MVFRKRYILGSSKRDVAAVDLHQWGRKRSHQNRQHHYTDSRGTRTSCQPELSEYRIKIYLYDILTLEKIRLTSLDSYGMGSLIIIDALHIPFGCSVWPAFWTYGIETAWPLSGEIDIIEAINNMDNNQIALHTVQGCTQQLFTPPAQTGNTLETDCSVPRGCIVAEKADSFGPGFAAAGGGVFALQMEVSGIYVWYWSVCDFQ